MNNNAIEQFIGAVKESDYETDTTCAAIVSHIDGDGIVWVNLAGSAQETPTASVASDVKAGDIVNVEWRNNKLYITGNYTNPSAGMQRVTVIVNRVNEVEETANTAQRVAGEAKGIAGNTNQYFWHTEEGTDTGAHITEIPQADFLADPANGGGNLLARSNGIAVRDGLAELATFGIGGSRIGESNGMHISIDTDSIDFYSQLNDLIGYVNGLKAFFQAIEAVSTLYVGEDYVFRKTPSGSLGLYLR